MEHGEVGHHGQHVEVTARDLGLELVVEVHVRVLVQNIILVLVVVAQVKLI